MLENKKTKHDGIHYSRYIMSWYNAGGGDIGYSHKFEEWLASEGCTEDEIRDMREMAMNGKYELECHAKVFINNVRKN